jgi:hypothetical protein
VLLMCTSKFYIVSIFDEVGLGFGVRVGAGVGPGIGVGVCTRVGNGGVAGEGTKPMQPLHYSLQQNSKNCQLMQPQRYPTDRSI